MKSKEMHLLFKTFICTILISSQAESSGYGSLAVPEFFFFQLKGSLLIGTPMHFSSFSDLHASVFLAV